MTTAGVCMVKDEVDVIGGTLAHQADEVDFLLVVDNGSTDGTRELLAELERSLPLTVLDDPEIAYHQASTITALAAQAAERGARWVLPFDADEIWFADDRVSDVLAGHFGCNVVSAQLYDHVATAVDRPDPDPFKALVWRRVEPAPLPKVAFRWCREAQVHNGNHGVTLPEPAPAVGSSLQVRHFPYRSPRQFVSKARNGAAAMRASSFPASEGAHWRAYGELLEREGEARLIDLYLETFFAVDPEAAGLVEDPAPYCRWRESRGA